jgi:hypothetical protein
MATVKTYHTVIVGSGLVTFDMDSSSHLAIGGIYQPYKLWKLSYYRRWLGGISAAGTVTTVLVRIWFAPFISC